MDPCPRRNRRRGLTEARKRAGDALPLVRMLLRASAAVPGSTVPGPVVPARQDLDRPPFAEKILGRPTKLPPGRGTGHRRRLLFVVLCGASYSPLAAVAGPDQGRPATRYGGEALAACESGLYCRPDCLSRRLW